jgi:hypothetical protein
MENRFEKIDEKYGNNKRLFLSNNESHLIKLEEVAAELGVTEDDVKDYLKYIKYEQIKDDAELKMKALLQKNEIIEKSKLYIPEVKLEEWIKYIDKDIEENGGRVTKEILHIIEAISNGKPLNDIIDEFITNNRINIFEIREGVLRYSKDDTGVPFFKETHRGEWNWEMDLLVDSQIHHFDVVKGRSHNNNLD